MKNRKNTFYKRGFCAKVYVDGKPVLVDAPSIYGLKWRLKDLLPELKENEELLNKIVLEG